MLLQLLDYLGVAVFAIAGSIVASRKGLDFVAFLFFATLTGIGGGTLRDLLLDVPVFWLKSEGYLLVCLGVSIFMWFFAHIVEGFGKPLRWADAIGMSAYSVMGAAKTLSVGDTPVVAVLMGVATATFGGVLRDVIAGEPSAIVKSEIYVTAAFVGAGGFVAMKAFGLSGWVAAAIAALLALLLRGGAIEFGWSMPGYKNNKRKDT
ncbi:trimeric intracellular cation channel family protein [Roseibium sp.]|uniref:trimeric intracellular cation channel family protein n=1 Tax=Roseibium sp. TaxID=1936156 RepID=UPI003A972FF8